MTGGARRFGWVAALGLGFALAGCAAGAPGAVVPAPTDGGQAALAPVLTPVAADGEAASAPAVEDAGSVPASDAGAAPVAAAEASVDEAPMAEPAVSDAAAAETDPSAAGADPAAVPAQPSATTRSANPAPDATAPEAAVAPGFTAGADVEASSAADAAPAPAAVQQDAAPTTDQAAAAPAVQGERPPAPAPDGSGVSQLIEGHADGRKEVALTFDAGADAGYAAAILDLLRDEGIKATFGMTGTWAEQHPDLIQRMVAEGHQLINHTWTHGSITGANTGQPAMTYEQLADELARTEQIIRDLTGYELKPYFRPPYGDYDLDSLGYLHDLGYPFTIMWTCDTQGWRGWGAEQILEYCTQVPLEDDIILMHVGASAAGDYEVLPSMIAWYRANGYAFVSVEEMLQP